MQRVSGFAEQGANSVWTMGYASANVFQETYPFAKIAVYLTGTTTLATIFLDNNTPPTPLSNPFTADENGWWWFYIGNGRYDIQIWPRTPVDLPWTISDVVVTDISGATLDPASIELNNGVCPPVIIQFDQNCDVVFTNSGGTNILALSQTGDLTIPGALNANSLDLNSLNLNNCILWSNAAGSMSICIDQNANLSISNAARQVAYISQAGGFGVTAETGGQGIDVETHSDQNVGAVYYAWRTRGTAANPQPIQAGDMLLYFGWGGLVSGFQANQGCIAVYAGTDPRSADLIFYTNDGTGLTPNSDGFERMRITGSGNVGIGTSNPIWTLDVVATSSAPGSGNVRAAGFVASFADATGTNVEGMEIYWDPVDQHRGVIQALDKSVTPNVYRPLFIEANPLVLNNNAGAGNVGIGTFAPQWALDVAGSLNITGQYLVNGVPIEAGFGVSQWLDATGGIYYAAGMVAIGGPPSWAEFEVITTPATASTQGIANSRYSDDSRAPVYYSWKARGTPTAELPVQVGDFILYFGWGGLASSFPASGADQGALAVVVTQASGLADFVIYTNDGTDSVGNGYERMRITSDGVVWMPSGNLVVTGDGPQGISTQRHSDDYSGPVFYSWKSRGTRASQQPVQTGDYLLDLSWGGLASGFNANQGAMQAIAGAAPGSCDLVFLTNDGTNNTPDSSGYERVRITSGGMVLISSGSLVVTGDGQEGISSQRFSDDAYAPLFYSWKSRGVRASPQPIQAGDYLMDIGWGGNVPGFNANQGGIQAIAGADPRSSDLVFFTNDGTNVTANASGYERMRITASGQVTMSVALSVPFITGVYQFWAGSVTADQTIFVGNPNGLGGFFGFENPGHSNTIAFYACNGTVAAPTLPAQGNLIGGFAVVGYVGLPSPDEWNYDGPQAVFVATQDWTAASNPAAFAISTTAPNNNFPTIRLYIADNGNVGINLNASLDPLVTQLPEYNLHVMGTFGVVDPVSTLPILWTDASGRVFIYQLQNVGPVTVEHPGQQVNYYGHSSHPWGIAGFCAGNDLDNQAYLFMAGSQLPAAGIADNFNIMSKTDIVFHSNTEPPISGERLRVAADGNVYITGHLFVNGVQID